MIDTLYRSMDDLVGRTVAKCQDEETLLFVISDHGFNGFRYGIDLNCWLEQNGYLKFHEGRREEQYLAGVDWSQSRAFALGLSGMFINVRGKYEQGIVEPGEEAAQLCAEIAGKMSGLVDQERGEPAIRNVYQTGKVYRGPYKENAPDLIIGYERNYRVAWDTAIGKTSQQLFHANVKAWSGDHCIDPVLIPGVLFCNHNIESERPRLLDIGPTILDMFGVATPEFMDGKPLTVAADEDANDAPQSAELQEA
jgi:predicted AlkP superfamily phosphohydrolase/phosphomutase